MADEPFYSSQGSHYEKHRIALEDEQENIPSSPPLRPTQASPAHPRPAQTTLSASPRRPSPRIQKASSVKPKGLPTVTPNRFNRFFTPRGTLNTRGGRQSKAAQILRDITKNGSNRRRPEPAKGEIVEDHQERAAKRRKTTTFDLSSSPPPQSSPLKHVQAAPPTEIPIHDDEPASPCATDDDALSDLLEQSRPFPQPIRKIRQSGPTRRILQRSFGGYDALDGGWRGADHCGPWKGETANFVSTPNDIHSFRGAALPFCTASCNTNSLIAIGDEEGSIRLVDSSSASPFGQTHVRFKVHSNAIMDLAFSSDDYMLASASGDQTARIVDMQTQNVVCILSGHVSSVKQIRFQPNNDRLLTTSGRDGTVQLWDLRCSERGSVSSLRLGQKRFLNEDGVEEPSIRHSTDTIAVGPAHRSHKGTTSSGIVLKSEDASVSITAVQHLPNGREHLLLTASEINASVKLWDLRNARSRTPVALAATPLPETHRRTRNFGISSMVLSGDGARLYTVCKDATVYAYSTNHILLGPAPEMSSTGARRRAPKETQIGVQPLDGFKHPALRTETFYIKSALRPAQRGGSELLAVGSTEGSAVLFPTDERHLRRPDLIPDSEEEEELSSLSQKLAQASGSSSGKASQLPIYEQGTPLVRGHSREVTSLTWTHEGELVTVSDDFSVRCWREDANTARHLRTCGEGGGQRWGHGWAVVDGEWDEEEE
jgi:WD40 repeat protein